MDFLFFFYTGWNSDLWDKVLNGTMQGIFRPGLMQLSCILAEKKLFLMKFCLNMSLSESRKNRKKCKLA